ncbi:MAG: histidine phosphatase family protein [Ignavibacteria bacterium]
MKHLYLIRHAKSSWDDPGLKDHDRPMNKRGKRDAPLMAKILRKKDVNPDLIISSSAKRALDFAKIIADELDHKKNKMLVTKDLYMADEDDMLKMLRSVDDKCNTVFMVGHNPDLTSFANSLASYDLDNIPTSGIFQIDFDTDSWKDAGYGKGKFVSFEYPKKYYS